MTGRTVGRFYKAVSVEARDGGHAVLLDEKPLKTPGRASVNLPTLSLAEAVAREWREQGERIDPPRMPLTGLTYAALDAVPRERGRVIEHILGFGRSDLLTYRAPRTDDQIDLAPRQARAWDPLLEWIAGAHGIRLQTGEGVGYVQQPEGALLALEKLVCSLDDFKLAALDRTAALTGSLVVALAVLEGRLDAREAFAAALVDELYQAEKWGRDAEAEARRTHILFELEAAEQFMRLAEPSKA